MSLCASTYLCHVHVRMVCMYVAHATMSMYIPTCILTYVYVCYYYPYVYVRMCILTCILDVYLTLTLYASASTMIYVSSGCSSLCYVMVLRL
jgi:hypothetical protein